jgi:hypothetical protein
MTDALALIGAALLALILIVPVVVLVAGALLIGLPAAWVAGLFADRSERKPETVEDRARRAQR